MTDKTDQEVFSEEANAATKYHLENSPGPVNAKLIGHMCGEKAVEENRKDRVDRRLAALEAENKACVELMGKYHRWLESIDKVLAAQSAAIDAFTRGIETLETHLDRCMAAIKNWSRRV